MFQLPWCSCCLGEELQSWRLSPLPSSLSLLLRREWWSTITFSVCVCVYQVLCWWTQRFHLLAIVNSIGVHSCICTPIEIPDISFLGLMFRSIMIAPSWLRRNLHWEHGIVGSYGSFRFQFEGVIKWFTPLVCMCMRVCVCMPTPVHNFSFFCSFNFGVRVSLCSPG